MRSEKKFIGGSWKAVRPRFVVAFIFFALFTFYFSLLTVSYAAPLTEESTLQVGGSGTSQANDEGTALTPSFLKLFSGLAVVLGVMLVFYYLMKEHLGKRGAGGGKGRLINVIGSHYLAPKKAIMLVEVAGEYLVVGVGEEINLLARLENVSQESGVRSQESGFSDALKMATAKESSLSVIDSIKENLNRLKGKR